MGRLIDADDLIEIAEDILSRQNHKQVTIPSWLEKAINNTPTAYDVEKVVAEIKEEKYAREEKFQYDTRTQEKMSSYNMGLNKAISIVKRGGVE